MLLIYSFLVLFFLSLLIAFYTILTFPALSCKPDLLTARSPYFSPIQFPIIPPQQQQIEFPTALPSSAPPYAPALAVALEVAFASSLLHKIFVESNIESTIIEFWDLIEFLYFLLRTWVLFAPGSNWLRGIYSLMFCSWHICLLIFLQQRIHLRYLNWKFSQKFQNEYHTSKTGSGRLRSFCSSFTDFVFSSLIHLLNYKKRIYYS